VVPTSPAIRDETVQSLVECFERHADNLARKAGIDRQTVVEQAYITPSCGTGSMEVGDSERVFQLLGETSRTLREKYGF
jgi:hypothetical protein